ncbi:MAG: hypothetical protein ACKV2Q_06600 [Planctomycetaceae bacterium]
MKLKLLIIVVGLCLSLSARQTAIAQADARALNQQQAATKVAERVRQIAAGTTEIFIREFRGVGENNVGLSRMIGEALTKSGVTVRRGAAVEVEGRVLRLPADDSQPLQGFTIRSTIVLADGSPRNFSIDVLNAEEGQIATGTTGETAAPPDDPQGSPPEAALTVVDGVIRPSRNSPYGVELLVERGSNYESLRPVVVGKTVSVKVRKGDIVAVRLHNSSQFEAAAAVHVDGLTRFALADSPDRRGGLDLVGPKQKRDIKGYYRDDRSVDAFRIGEYSKSVAAQHLPTASESGTFTIAFRAAWKPGDPLPPNEPPQTKSVGIEAGPKREDPTELVQREIGGVRAVVKVFYGE